MKKHFSNWRWQGLMVDAVRMGDPGEEWDWREGVFFVTGGMCVLALPVRTLICRLVV